MIKVKHWAAVAALMMPAAAVYYFFIYPFDAREALPESAALIWAPHAAKNKDNLVDSVTGQVLFRLFPELGEDLTAVQQVIGPGRLPELLMANRVSAGRYALAGVDSRCEWAPSGAPVSVYRGVGVYAAGSGCMAARVRNLVLFGRMPAQVEAMIKELDNGGSVLWQGGVQEGRFWLGTENLLAWGSGFFGAPWRELLKSAGRGTALTGALRSEGGGIYAEGHTLGTGPAKSPGQSAGFLQSGVLAHLPVNIAWASWRAQGAQPKAGRFYEQYVSPWAGPHYAVAQLPLPGQLANNRVLYLPVAAEAALAEALEQVRADIGYLKEYPFQVFQVQQVLGDGLFEEYIAGGLRNPYWADLGSYLAVSPSAVALEQALSAYWLGLTLGGRPEAAAPEGGALSAWWFVDVEKSAGVWPQAFERRKEEVGALLSGFSYLQGHKWPDGKWALQAGPAGQKGRASALSLLWQKPLEGMAVSGPYVVGDQVLLELSGGRVQSIGADGTVSWEARLQDTLVGPPVVLSNEQTGAGQRILLTTPRAGYLLDEQGRAEAGFPVIWPGVCTAAATMSVLEKPGVLGIWAPLSNKRIVGYDQRGRPLEGWGDRALVDTTVHSRLQHAQRDGKDYLFALSDTGLLHAFRRDGAPRFLPVPLGKGFGQSLQLQAEPPHYRLLAGGTDGRVAAVNFEGEFFRLSLGQQAEGASGVLFVPLWGDERYDYLSWDGKYIRLHGYSGQAFQQIWETAHDVKGPIGVFTCALGVGWIDKERRKVYLADSQGQLLSGFPVSGQSPLAVADGVAYCVYGEALYAYALRE